MKTINKIFLSCGVAAAAMGMTSCVNDLDLLPTDPNTTTPATFEEDPEGYMNRVMASVYLGYATHGPNNNALVQGFDGGMSTFQRSAWILEEVPSDEACWFNDLTDYGTFHYGIIPTNNRVVFGTYSRFMINVALCNDFIQTVNNGYFHLETDALKAKADEYIRQCKILRSGAYFYLISNFGNPPYADENVAIGATPAQLGQAETYKLVVATLEDVLAEYGSVNTPVYGTVGYDVAEALLVKFYLNAEVFSGEANWGKCLEHAQNIINRHKGKGFQGSGLAESYRTLFGHNNNEHVVGGSFANEIIWYIPQDDVELMSYANGDVMMNAFAGSSTDLDPFKFDPTSWLNENGGWKCAVARHQLVDAFDFNADYTECPDDRTYFWGTGAQGFVPTNDIFDNAHWGTNGFLPIKYSNWDFNEDGSLADVQPAVIDHPRVGYAMIRLAEIYLSAAEAILHGAGDKATAVEYVNLIRERAGLEAWASTDLSLESLQQERQRELYTECVRRTDLVRYGKWISGYNWNWKNNAKYGRDFDPSFILYPIPAQYVELGGYTQNPGY